MDYNDELADLVKNTFLKDVIENVVKKEGIENYTLNVTAASAKGENFLGWLCKVKVSGEKEKVKTVLHLVLKIPPQSEIMREKMPLEIVYKTEIYVYNVILPELCSLQDIFNVPKSERFEYVKCFKADSERLKEYIVLEDMHARGFKMANRKVGLGVSHLKVVLKRMASYHALSFAYKKINPENFSEMVTNVGGVGNYSSMKEFIVAGVDRAIGVLTDPEAVKRTRAFANEVMEKIHFYVSPESVSPYSVLCHGDFWNNNLLFRYEDEEPVEMVMVDWQVARYCSPVTDIAYFLFSITDYETRKQHLVSLLDYYYECISKSLGYMGFNAADLFPKAAYRDQINKILPFGLFMSFMLLPAVLGEQEDVPDMEEILANKETFVADDVKFVNNESSARFVSRINGIVQTFIDMNVV